MDIPYGNYVSRDLGEYMFKYIKLREMPELKESAAEWFHSKWGVPMAVWIMNRS